MKKTRPLKVLYFVPVIILAVLEFLYQRATFFVMDDIWYQTNLVTGQKLSSALDVIKSQIWHYFNWGGRSITHTILQFDLMGGALFCDIMNLLMTFLLCIVIASFAKERIHKLFYFYASFSLIISLNASFRYNMFWQSGAVNYLYSTVWILTFIKVFLRELEDDSVKALPGITFWIVPLGLITGWSNENMGPASFILSLMVIFLVKKNKKYDRIPWWMTLGCISSLIGSILVIVAPGNFVRSAFTNNSGLLRTIIERTLSMLTGACSFLLPPLVIAVTLFTVVTMVLGFKVSNRDIVLIITSILAFGAMILSPHFPPRAVFGIMILLIVLILSFLEQISERFPKFSLISNIFIICTYVYSIIEMYVCVCYYY